jgi:NTE family protein
MGLKSTDAPALFPNGQAYPPGRRVYTRLVPAPALALAFACALPGGLTRAHAGTAGAPPSGIQPADTVADVGASGRIPALPARPRIGLALSGGGARGFAHTGVLKALEALRVPVDCVAGTSAGSAVGAAYAVGLSPQEIESRLRSADWDGGMFSDEPLRPALPYRTKIRSGAIPRGVTLGVGTDGVRGTGGIFAGQQIELFLHEMLGLSTELASFDTLPIPFRAIATDLASGELVVQDRGSLVHAVRASMAVPSAFSPVKVDGRLLVDGGLTQNLPVQAVRQMCADVVIAVNIGSPLLKADELDSVFGVGLQMVSILMERNVADSLAAMRPDDVLIVPDLTGISAVDFGRGVSGIPAGEQAVLAAAGRLQRLALPEEAYQAWQRQRQARAIQPPLVSRVQVAPTRFVDPAFFALGDSGAGGAPGPVDVDGLHRRIRKWTGSGDFTSIAYSVRPSGSGYTLWIDPQEKPWGPDYLQIGIGGQADSHGNGDFSVQAALRRTWRNAWGAEWLSVARFGRTRELETRWFQPLGTGSALYLEPRASLTSTPLRVFVGNDAAGEFRIERREVEVGAGLQGPLGQVHLGLVSATILTDPVIGLLTVPPSRGKADGARVLLAYDQLDDIDFPRQGGAVRAEAFRSWRSQDDGRSYWRSSVQALAARSFGEHTVRVRARWAQVADSSALRDFVTAGGFLDLTGYQQGQFSGRAVELLSLGYTRRILSLPQPFGSGLFAGAAVEAARIRSPLGIAAASIRRHSVSAFAGAATALGPAYLGIGIGEHGSRALYLLLGRP